VIYNISLGYHESGRSGKLDNFNRCAATMVVADLIGAEALICAAKDGREFCCGHGRYDRDFWLV